MAPPFSRSEGRAKGTDMSDLITFSSSALPHSVRVLGFRGQEAISRPYQFEIFLAYRDNHADDLDLSDAVGAKAKLTLDRQSDLLPPFNFCGVIASIELMHELDGHALFRAVLVPRLWQLGLSRHSRIFTKKKLPDVITSILEDNGFTTDDYELRLGAYDTEEHITQYMESDLDFISRWMEREGIFYYFEHTDDVEKLILADKKAYDKDVLPLPIPYHPQLGHDRSAGASFRAFTCKHSTLPAKVVLKDYDYLKPNLLVSGNAPVSHTGAGDVSVYGQRFFAPGQGEKLAKLRAEELLARQVVYRARGHRMHLRTGYTFELEDHPRHAFNQKYLTISAEHHGNQGAGSSDFKELLKLPHDDVYHVELDAIPASTQFRAESKTEWPRIHGYENGIVDGPADSEYAQIDDQGRYNLKFKFDESNLRNGKATTWVRMMQPHGGKVEGFHFPLRKGTEVICAFLSGDVDRPVITGVVPTAITPSPVVASNHTQNIIQTGSENYITMEDKSGVQFINIFCPISTTNLYMGHDRSIGGHGLTLPSGPAVAVEGKRPRSLGAFNFDLRTEGNGQIHTGDNMQLISGGEFQLAAHEMVTLYANSEWHVDVNGDADEKYWSKFDEEVVGAVDIKYDDKFDFRVTGPTDEKYNDTLDRTVKGDVDIKYKSKLERTVEDEAHEKFNNGHIVEIKPEQKVTVTGNKEDKITGKYDIDVTGDMEIKCNKWEVTQNSQVIWNLKGTFLKTNMTMSHENTLGLKSELMVGGTSDIVVGVANEMIFGAAFDTKLGFRCSIELPGKCESHPFKEEETPVSITVNVTRIEQRTTNIAIGALHIHPYSLTIM